jgi:hypothetical protein
VPFRTLFPFLTKITPGSMDFSAGPGPRTLRLPGLPPVGPLICYEAIFPGAVVDPQDRPDWLLNLTNDGWYGISSGPYQHFASARLRAVEEGVPLVRAANTGISGVVDAYGRVTARLGLGETGVRRRPASRSRIDAYARGDGAGVPRPGRGGRCGAAAPGKIGPRRRKFTAGMRRYAFLSLTAYDCMYIKVLATVVLFLREEPPSHAAWT